MRRYPPLDINVIINAVRIIINLLITILTAATLMLAGCNVITGAGEPVSVTISPVLFHIDQFNIEVQLRPGWAAVEGPTSLRIPRSEGLISFNSWGQDDFWAYAIQDNNPDGSVSLHYGPSEVASQVRKGGAYVALVMTSGPPRAIGSELPIEYALDDLSGLYQPHDWRQDSATWAYFKAFYRDDSDLTLVIACHTNASDETVDRLNELLKTWRFIAE